MAKLDDASKDVVKLVEKVWVARGIPQFVQVMVFCDNKQKNDPCKLVKSNDLIDKYSEGIDFTVVINEKIFNALPEDMREMKIDECLAGAYVNENDVTSIIKPDFMTHTGVLQKYGHESIIKLHESIKSLYENEKQKADQEKAETATKKGKRGRKSKF